MAPKTTKKSSLNIIPQTTSRQGDKQSQNQNPKEALLSDQSNNGDDSMYTDADEFEASQEEDQLPHSSQSVQEGLQQIIGNVVDEQRKRDAERKKKTRDSYVEDTQYMRGRIDEFFDEHEQQASSVHNDQLKRLQDLLAHKVQIESAMERELARLKADYDAHSKDLRSCIAHRIKEMQ